MKTITSSGVVLILFASAAADLLLPTKTLASSFQATCVRQALNKGYSAMKADYLCSCWDENYDRYDGDMDLVVRVCHAKYTAHTAPRMSPSQGGGSFDLCTGANAALVRASGLDWCTPTIRVEPVRRPEWQFMP